MKKKVVGVIGYGYVGKAIVNFFKDHYIVEVYDPNYKNGFDGPGCPERDKAIFFNNSIEELDQRADLIVIAVPTPMMDTDDEFKACDVSIVEETVAKLKSDTPILIKSTVAPGTTERLCKQYNKRIVFSPEFAGESKYWSPYEFDTDMKACPFVIFGGEDDVVDYVMDFMVVILGPTKKYYRTNATEAELIKYAENSFFATKVTFSNELKSICDAFGANFYKVRECWLLDPRINPMHTMVFPENRGFGGKCYPKDVNAIVAACRANGYEPELLQQVLRSNKKFREMNDETD
jgi:nucleotide sugar dehydrogenase